MTKDPNGPERPGSDGPIAPRLLDAARRIVVLRETGRAAHGVGTEAFRVVRRHTIRRFDMPHAFAGGAFIFHAIGAS